MGPRQVKVSVPSAGGAVDVSVRAYQASGDSSPVLIFGHGAGAGQDSPFMVEFAQALAARDVETVTFNFPYTEQRRRVPDRNDVLEACWREVVSAVRARVGPRPVFIGGKSMGGRIASQVVAGPGSDGLGVAGLVFLGYPLHPPGRPHQLRVGHWPGIRVPALFVQGARDTFGTSDELREHLPQWGAPTSLIVIEDGDHSLKVRKGAGRSQAEIYASVQDATAEWIRRGV